MPESVSLLWTVILAAAPLVGAVALFAVHVLQVRNLQTQTRTLELQAKNLEAQNLKLTEELLKLRDERVDREGIIQIADFEQTQRFAAPFQRTQNNTSIVFSLSAVFFLSSYALFGYEALNRSSPAELASTSSNPASLKAQLEQEQAKVIELTRQREELRRRLDEEQSEDIRRLSPGDVRVMLRWNNAADVDLFVVDPSGETISYEHTQSRSNGRLDRDETRGFGPESIFWPRGRAPKGRYKVYVSLYSGPPAAYSVQVESGGDRKNYSGTVSVRKEPVLVADFVLR